MKRISFPLIILFIGICLLPPGSLEAQVIGIQWNIFLGSSSNDTAGKITVGSSGKIYVTGRSYASWGSPVQAHSGGADGYVACLDSSGNLLWNTFLGSASNESSHAIALSSSGNIYVIGESSATWGSPVAGYNGAVDVFAACLDSSGNLLWNTFLGCGGNDVGRGLVLDSSGNLYVAGHSNNTWGSPINAFSGGADAFVAATDSSGDLLWNTFLGSAGNDEGRDIIQDGSGNLYVTGHCSGTWGSPVNTFSGNTDAFVAATDSSGNLLWNTFLGSANVDDGYSVALSISGDLYITGHSNTTWGSPINAFSGNYDAFIAGMDSSGNLLWNTFLGSSNDEYGRAIALDSSGNIYVAGHGNASWGSPINAFSGDNDAFAAGMDSSGNLVWNTFLGCANYDAGYGIALDSSGNIYVVGKSDATWGSPINAHNGGEDGFVVQVGPQPIPDIQANGADGPLSITQSDTLQIKISLVTCGLSDNVDYWLAYKGPSGWMHYNNSTKKWESGLGVTHQGPLMDLNNKKVFQSSGLPQGNYTFYFGVDMNMDGKVTKSSLHKDEVKVTVTSD